MSDGTWPELPGVHPAPNIHDAPDIYEIENRAVDPEGRIETTMAAIAPWDGKVVLDLGAGTGFHLARFHAVAAHVIAVEPHDASRLRAMASRIAKARPMDCTPPLRGAWLASIGEAGRFTPVVLTTRRSPAPSACWAVPAAASPAACGAFDPLRCLMVAHGFCAPREEAEWPTRHSYLFLWRSPKMGAQWTLALPEQWRRERWRHELTHRR